MIIMDLCYHFNTNKKTTITLISGSRKWVRTVHLKQQEEDSTRQFVATDINAWVAVAKGLLFGLHNSKT